MKYWIKLWAEILDDPKVGTLPDNLWRRMIELFLVAGEVDQDGLLPLPDQIAWRTRQPLKTILTDLGKLWDLGIVAPQGDPPDCPWMVVRFQERQRARNSTERTKLARTRGKTGTVLGRNVPENVPKTSQKRPKTVPTNWDEPSDRTEQNRTEQNHDDERVASDVLSDPLIDPGDPKIERNFKALMANYQDHISVSVNPILADEFKDLARDIPDVSWINDSFRIALANGIDRWPYIRTILDNSIKSGKGPGKKGQRINKALKGLNDDTPSPDEFKRQLENL